MFRRPWIKGLAALAALGVLGCAALFAMLSVEHRTGLTLPDPTGRFTVGRATYVWVDHARMDSLAPSPGIQRRLVVWIWYPSATAPSSPAATSEYLPAPWREPLALHSGVLMSKFLTRDPALVHAHSARDADVSPEQRTYPVVIMRSGIGALATDYTTLAEDLASHGYVVVGSDAPYSTSVVVFPDGQVVTRTPAGHPPENLSDAERERIATNLVTIWSADTGFELDQLEQLNASDPSGRFTGRLDLRAVGVFGHSFGGATAAQFCHDDHRCKAGIDIDGAPFGSVIREGLNQPFMFILSDHGNTSDPVSRRILANIQSIYDRLPNLRLRIAIRGAHHFSFSDQILLKSRSLIWILGRLGLIGGIDPRRGLAITTAYVDEFFDVCLKGAPARLLKGPSPLYPEVQFEPR